jgi:hypothetical protein
MAELGIQLQPKKDKPGFYIGMFYSRSLGKDYVVINTWKSNNVILSWDGTFASTLAGVEFRILLE